MEQCVFGTNAEKQHLATRCLSKYKCLYSNVHCSIGLPCTSLLYQEQPSHFSCKTGECLKPLDLQFGSAELDLLKWMDGDVGSMPMHCAVYLLLYLPLARFICIWTTWGTSKGGYATWCMGTFLEKRGGI